MKSNFDIKENIMLTVFQDFNAIKSNSSKILRASGYRNDYIKHFLQNDLKGIVINPFFLSLA